MRLIDADALLDVLEKDKAMTMCNNPDVGTLTGLNMAEISIGIAPTVDAVEVVRCKDCGFYEAHRNCQYGYCWHWDYEAGESPNEVDGDDFCSYGERRSDNAAD